MDIYLETSKVDSFSIAACEAAKLKIPVVSYAGILSETLGHFFTLEDKIGIINLLEMIIKKDVDKDQYINNAYKYVRENYSYEKIKGEYLTLADKLILHQ